jgi:hypothetical protein
MTSNEKGSSSFKPRNAFAAVIISTGLMIGVNGANIEASSYETAIEISSDGCKGREGDVFK